MSNSSVPAAEIMRMFSEEVEMLGGSVSDRVIDGPYLFARSIMPEQAEVAAGDRLRGGAAMMADDREIRLHPYVFRQVCKNGAIRAHAIETMRVELEGAREWMVDEAVRRAVRACAAPGALREGAAEMRSAMEQAADTALMMLPMMSAFPESQRGKLLAEIMTNFASEKDASVFGLMNAVTATARRKRDPRTRWKLEELGGGVPAAKLRPGPAIWDGAASEPEVVAV